MATCHTLPCTCTFGHQEFYESAFSKFLVVNFALWIKLLRYETSKIGQDTLYKVPVFPQWEFASPTSLQQCKICTILFFFWITDKWQNTCHTRHTEALLSNSAVLIVRWINRSRFNCQSSCQECYARVK